MYIHAIYTVHAHTPELRSMHACIHMYACGKWKHACMCTINLLITKQPPLRSNQITEYTSCVSTLTCIDHTYVRTYLHD